MGNCLEKSEAFLKNEEFLNGKEPVLFAEDCDKDEVYENKIRLVSEKVVRCWVLLGDTMRMIDRKVLAVHSIPRIFLKGTYQKPELQALFNKCIVSVL